jgi:hypothetical protein
VAGFDPRNIVSPCVPSLNPMNDFPVAAINDSLQVTRT